MFVGGGGRAHVLMWSFVIGDPVPPRGGNEKSWKPVTYFCRQRLPFETEINYQKKKHVFVPGGGGDGGCVHVTGGTGWRARDRHTSNRSRRRRRTVGRSGSTCACARPVARARARAVSRMRRAHAYECFCVSVRARRRPSSFLPFVSRHGSADRRAPNPLPPVAATAAAADCPALPRAAAHPVVRRSVPSPSSGFFFSVGPITNSFG